MRDLLGEFGADETRGVTEAVEPTAHGDLFDLLEAGALTHPDRPHVTLGPISLSYGETHRLSLVVARNLLKRGIGPRDRVGIALPNGPAYVVLCFALWRIGAVGVGMNTLYSAEHMAHQAHNAGLVLLFVSTGDETRMADVAGGVGCGLIACAPDGREFSDVPAENDMQLLELLRGEPLGNDVLRPAPGTLAMLQYTGGTTGLPKGAMLTHRSMVSSVQIACAVFPDLIRGHEIWYAGAPMTHASGLMGYVCLATAAAGEILITGRFNSDELLGLLRRGRITFLGGIPTMMTALLGAEGLDGIDWSRLKYAMTGGAATSVTLLQQFHTVSGVWIQQTYGLTETSGIAAAMRIGDVAENPTSTGAVLPGVRLEIRSIDDSDVLLGAGEVGEICVGGPTVMAGYWGVGTRTHLTSDGLMRTGDVGSLSADGFLHVVDRLKDMAVCSGYNVYPRVIDEAVAEHPAIHEAIAIGVPDSYRGETILVAAVLKPGQALSLDALRDFLADRLSPIEMPKRLIVVDELPKTENGKLSRRLIRGALQELATV